MVKRLHCLFLMSLLGSACMAGSESNIATEKPKEIKGNTIPKTEQRNVSKKKIDSPTITLKEDITKHPVFWTFVSVWPMSSYALVKILIRSPYRYRQDIQNGLLVTFTNNAKHIGLFFLLNVGIHAVISILLASWVSRWVGKKQKENGVVIPCFQVRLWRSLRFIYPSVIVIYFANFLNVLRHYIGTDYFIVEILLQFSPYIMSTFTYLGIVSYEDWKKGQKALPTITLKKDITKHPFLWVGVSIWSIFSFDLASNFMLWLGYQYLAAEQFKNNSKFIGLSFLSNVGIHAVISILLASWVSRWVGKKQKKNGVVIPSFKVRLWHSLRFIYPSIVVIYFALFLNELLDYYRIVIQLVRKLFWLSPYIMSTSTYFGILFYDNWKKGQKEDREAINKKEPVLDPQDKSLDVMKPLVA